MRPTRIITYAWGDRYIEELLSLTIPAILAPGNLPHVAAMTSCELVILTEEHSFSTFNAHPAIARAKQFCPVRLIGLDDLVSVKDKYGMALTYALHRGFSDLGAAMTETYQIFLNADFILADGCLRNLLPQLENGKRIVASPSYCVNSGDVIPELRKHFNPKTSTLSISPRELAALTLQYRHNTIRGKTLNQRAFNMRLMDQFYWLSDNSTLLGHQMPIAIVGMRPERYVVEPNSYWDHGLMKEYCPDAEVCVLGDSDEFLMMELRNSEVAADQIEMGWPAPKTIAERAIVFLTPYQLDFAKHSLTLHCGDLPPSVEVDRATLRAAVDDILSFVPEHLPSHLGHPQWDYHQPAFIEERHRYLSKRLGSRTQLHPPPEHLPEADKLWWKLDALEKEFAEQSTKLLDHKRRTIDLINKEESEFAFRRDEIDGAFLNELTAVATNGIAETTELNAVKLFQRESQAEDMVSGPYSAAISQHERKLTELTEQVRARSRIRQTVMDVATSYYDQRVAFLQIEYQQQQELLQSEYRAHIKQRVASAATPFVRITNGPLSPDIGMSGRHWLVQFIGQIYIRIFGRIPRVTRVNPRWASLRNLTKIVDEATEQDLQQVLLISSEFIRLETITDRKQLTRSVVTMAGVTSGNLARAFSPGTQFDLCVCEFDIAHLATFSDALAAVRPFVRNGGKIVGFYWNPYLTAVPPSTVADISILGQLPDTTFVRFSGSIVSVATLRVYNWITFLLSKGGIARSAVAAGALFSLIPVSLFANWLDTRRSTSPRQQDVDNCTSITLEIVVRGSPNRSDSI